MRAVAGGNRASNGGRPRSNEGESILATQSQNRSSRPKIRVEGKRKVWGTLKATTASAISSTIKLITKIEGLNVKRKFTKGSRSPQANGPNDVSKWWFIISGDESLLDRLSKEWAAVKLQTNWSIEPVFAYDSNSLPLHNSHAMPLMQSEPTEEMPGIEPSISVSPNLTSPSTHSPHSPHTGNANQSPLHTIPSPQPDHLPLESDAADAADQRPVSSISPSSADPQSS